MTDAAAKQIADLKADLAVLEEEREELHEQNQTLSAELAAAKQRLDWFQRQLFGPKSERVMDIPEAQQVFEEMMEEVDAQAAELGLETVPDPEEDDSSAKPKNKRRSRRRSLQERIGDPDMPREIIDIKPDPEDLICLETDEPLTPIGYDSTFKLCCKPACYYLKEYRYYKYASPTDPSQGIVQAPPVKTLFPGSQYDESWYAAIAVHKCMLHLPLYRQEEWLKTLDIDIPRSTLSRHYIQAAKALEPMYLLLRETVMKSEIAFVDETPVDFIERGHGTTKTGRVWVVVPGGTDPPYRLFHFTRDRQHHHATKLLKDFQGYLHADAFGGYEKVFARDDIIGCACWMHIRREFFEADDGPLAPRDFVLRKIRHIYRYERFVTERHNGDLQLRQQIRDERIRPLIGEILDRCRRAVHDREITPVQESLHKAIGYLQNRGATASNFCDDPRLSPDNGPAERAIRPFTIGRKNWLFLGSDEGARATSILTSLVQSARACDISPFAYLEDILRRLPHTASDQLATLLPANWRPQT